MLNVLAIAIVVSFAILLGFAYYQSKKTREELINEMKEEILSDEPAPVEQPAPVVAEVKEAVEAIVETAKAEVKELIAAQEAPAEKPKSKRRRGRPAQKKENNSGK
jgi:F0F1-type ATP synthase membrane subunit b/b'